MSTGVWTSWLLIWRVKLQDTRLLISMATIPLIWRLFSICFNPERWKFTIYFFLTSFQIILIASYDDAAFRLDSAARELLSSLGSTKSANLGFRDGWVFIGAKNIPSFEPQEAHIPNEKVDFLPQLVITLQFRTRTSMAIGPKPLKLAGVSPTLDPLGKCSYILIRS